jgi:two-component system, OmpR family, sensor histidine kinase VicK
LLWNEHALNEELRRMDKVQKEFINSAAHELRTPVQPILGLADVLLSKDGDIAQCTAAAHRRYIGCYED